MIAQKETIEAAMKTTEAQNDIKRFFLLKYIRDHGKPFEMRLCKWQIMINDRIYESKSKFYEVIDVDQGNVCKYVSSYGMTRIEAIKKLAGTKASMEVMGI